jgi:hypothetical protein
VWPGLTDPLIPMDSRAWLRRVFEPTLRKAGIQGAVFHCLRHTAASRRVMAGVDLASIKELLGHANVVTTMRYSHLTPSHMKEAVNRGSLFPIPNRDQNRDQDGEQRTRQAEPLDFVARPPGLEPGTLSLEG